MRNAWIIARREFKLYFDSPLAYAVAFFILLVDGILFALVFNYYATQGFGAPSVDPILQWMIILFLFLCPMLTMRLISDEVRMGTIELLLTAPIRDYELVVGKWLGAFLFSLVIIAVTLIYPFIFNVYTQPGIDQPMMMSAYLGLILAVGTFLAVGTAMSSLFTNQVASYLAALAVLILLWWLLGFIGSSLPSGGTLFGYLDLSTHFDSFQTGLISLADVMVFLSLIALGLFSGSVIVESRRWRA